MLSIKPSDVKAAMKYDFNLYKTLYDLNANLIDKLHVHNQPKLMENNEFLQYRRICYWDDIQRGIFKNNITNQLCICKAQCCWVRVFDPKYAKFKTDKCLITCPSSLTKEMKELFA